MQLTHQADILPFNHTLLTPHPLPRVRGCENLHLTQTNGVRNFSINHSGDVPSLKDEPSLFNLSNSLPISFNASEYLDSDTIEKLGGIWESFGDLTSKVSDLGLTVARKAPGQVSSLMAGPLAGTTDWFNTTTRHLGSVMEAHLPSPVAAFVKSASTITLDVIQYAGARVSEFNARETSAHAVSLVSHFIELAGQFFTNAYQTATSESAKNMAYDAGRAIRNLPEYFKNAYDQMSEVRLEEIKSGTNALATQLMKTTANLIDQGHAMLKEFGGDTNASFAVSTTLALCMTAIAVVAAQSVIGS